MVNRSGSLPLGLLVIAALGLATSGHAVELDPKAVAVVTPDQFIWRDPTDRTATNQTILHGDPTKPGLYIYINKFKPNRFGNPHYHPNDRFIVVTEGAGWRGTGPVVDPAHAMRLPKGSFMIDHALKVHWDGTKDRRVRISLLATDLRPTSKFLKPQARSPASTRTPSRSGHRTRSNGRTTAVTAPPIWWVIPANPVFTCSC